MNLTPEEILAIPMFAQMPAEEFRQGRLILMNLLMDSHSTTEEKMAAVEIFDRIIEIKEAEEAHSNE